MDIVVNKFIRCLKVINDSKYDRAEELVSAVCNNDEKRVSTLLEEGVDVHYNDNEALCWLYQTVLQELRFCY